MTPPPGPAPTADLLLDDEEPVADAGKIALAQARGARRSPPGSPLADAERHTAEATVDLRGEWQALDLLRAPLREGRATVAARAARAGAGERPTDLRVLCEQAVNVPPASPRSKSSARRTARGERYGSGPVPTGRTGGSLTWSREQASRGPVGPAGAGGGCARRLVRDHRARRGSLDGDLERPLTARLSLPLEVTIPAVERYEVALRFPGEGLAGRVVDDEGEPVARARVSELLGGAFALSGADGAFVLSGIPPGPYAVQAREGDLASEIVEGVLEADRPEPEIVLVLGEGRRPQLAVRVANRRRGAGLGAFVFLDLAGQGVRILTTDATGPGHGGALPGRCPSGCGWRRRPAGGGRFGSWVPWREARGGLRATLGDARLLVRLEERGKRRRAPSPCPWRLGSGSPLQLLGYAAASLAGRPAPARGAPRRELPDEARWRPRRRSTRRRGDRRDHPRRLTGRSPAFRVGLPPSRARVEVDDALDRAAADGAEGDAVAGEHDGRSAAGR